jgi:hypothetical protein
MVDEDYLGHLIHEQQTMLNKLMIWFKRTYRVMSLTQPTSWTSAVDLDIPSSMRTSGINKFVQGRCQRSLEISTNMRA